MRKEYSSLMKQYGGYIPFDKLSSVHKRVDSKKVKRDLTKKGRRGKLKRGALKKGAKTASKECQCKKDFVVEKGGKLKHCAKCTNVGIIIRGEDDILYILKKIRSTKKWVKI